MKRQEFGSLVMGISAANKASELEPEESIEDKLISVLKQCEVFDKEDIDEALLLFRDQKYQELKKIPRKKYRSTF